MIMFKRFLSSNNYRIIKITNKKDILKYDKILVPNIIFSKYNEKEDISNNEKSKTSKDYDPILGIDFPSSRFNK